MKPLVEKDTDKNNN